MADKRWGFVVAVTGNHGRSWAAKYMARNIGRKEEPIFCEPVLEKIVASIERLQEKCDDVELLTDILPIGQAQQRTIKKIRGKFPKVRIIIITCACP